MEEYDKDVLDSWQYLLPDLSQPLSIDHGNIEAQNTKTLNNSLIEKQDKIDFLLRKLITKSSTESQVPQWFGDLRVADKEVSKELFSYFEDDISVRGKMSYEERVLNTCCFVSLFYLAVGV